MTLRREEGFTVVEVLVAMALAVIVILGILATLDKSGATSLAQQRDTQAISIAEAEIERARAIVKTYGFPALALSSAPTGVTSATRNPTDPNAFVAGSVFSVKRSFNDTASADVATEPLVVAASAVGGADRLAPGPDVVVSGTQRATVWRYVTRRANDSCPATVAASCSEDSKRVTVAVRIDGNGADLQRTTPTYMTTVINAGVPSNQANGSGGLGIGVNLP